MEVLDMLDRLPAIADAIRRSRDPETPPCDEGAGPGATPWALVAHEAGHAAPGTVRLRSYAEARAMALEPSDLGFMVAVHEDADRVRLRLWPPQP